MSSIQVPKAGVKGTGTGSALPWDFFARHIVVSYPLLVRTIGESNSCAILLTKMPMSLFVFVFVLLSVFEQRMASHLDVARALEREMV